MTKKLIIVGKAASGKDYLKKYLESCGLSVCVAETTRPIRKGEEEGKDYSFIEELEFKGRHLGGWYLEVANFNGWYYGTPMREWETKQVFIMNPRAVESLSKKARESSYVIYLDIPEDVLRNRLEKRGDADSVERRIDSDKKDFKDFSEFDVRIMSPEFCPETLMNFIKTII